MNPTAQPSRRPYQFRSAPGIAAAVAAVAMSATTWCSAAPSDAPLSSGVTFSMSQTAAQPMAAATAAQSANRSTPTLQTTTHTMLWGSVSGLAAGVGVEQQRPYAFAGLPLSNTAATMPSRSTADMLLGIAVATGDHTRLELKTSMRRSDDDAAVAQRPLRLGLSFKSRDPYAELRKGALMRMEISGPTVFSLRPRGGHLAMVVTSNW